MRITRVKKYTCIDGEVFYGDKKAAFEHERTMNDIYKQLEKEQQIEEILGRDVFKFETENIAEKIDIFYDGMFDTEVRDLIEELFNNSICPNDLDSLAEMAKMIHDVIKDFGGPEVIKNLYDFVESWDKPKKK
jgi:hypothetical protein